MRTCFILIAVCLIAAGMASQPAQAVPYYDSCVNYNTGSYPVGVATADFNGDTYLDLVTADYAANSVSVLLGDGNGSFGTATHYSTIPSQHPDFVRTGDMDRNGTIDIVTGGTMGFCIFYGNGDGTFAAVDNRYFGQTVFDIVVADFDNDTYLDIATCNTILDTVYVHFNNHDSTYTTTAVVSGISSRSIATGYFDGDNYLDMVVGTGQGRVWNLKNDQSRGFVGTEVHIGILDDAAHVAAVDLNGDTVDDFAVYHWTNDFIFTYLNNGDGTYTVDQAYVPPHFPYLVVFHDVNYDTWDDMLLVIYGTQEIQLWLNDGSSNFTYDTSYTTPGSPRYMAFGDFDGDTYPDMAATSYETDDVAIFINRLSLLLSVDDVDTDGALPGAFSLAQNYPNPFNPTTTIRFSLPRASHVTIDVFNMLGQTVTTLVDEPVTAGVKETTWDGTDASGIPVASGIYFYRITTENYSSSRTMLLLK